MDSDEEFAGFGSSSDGMFRQFGTPLPEIDADGPQPSKKPIHPQDQIVTDENGKRRFHGAFTGGFSAGFWNTVGSRDGWTPAQFKSSRADKKDGKQQRPEDFMDEEDMGDFGFAPRGLKASNEYRHGFAAPQNERKRRGPENKSSEEFQAGPIPGEPVLEQLFKRPEKETVGIRLLRSMGWRPGQGIGPRLSKKMKNRKKISEKRMFGPSLPDNRNKDQQESSEDEDIDPKYKEFRFAPDDIPDFVIMPKENNFGIGYSGLDRDSDVLGGSGFGGKFSGVSAPSAQPQQRFVLFDDPTAGLGGQQKADNNKRRQLDKRKGGLKIGGQAFGVGAFEEEDDDIYQSDNMNRYDFELKGEIERQRDLKKGERKSRWGKEKEDLFDFENKVVDGFVAASAKTKMDKAHFPPPQPPKGWTPNPKLVRKSRFEVESTATTNPTPAERMNVLSDDPRKKAEEAKTASATSSDLQLQKLLSTAEEAASKPAELGSFKPFSSNEEKQKRYEKYLVCVKNGRGDALAILQPKSMTEWERERERVEFERAALLFKPMSGSFNSKFVSAGSSEADTKGGLQEKKEDDDATKAARMKMYGKLTHDKMEWHPARMLCVRFNVKNPYADNSVIGVPTAARLAADKKFELFGRVEEATAKKEILDSGPAATSQPMLPLEKKDQIRSDETKRIQESENKGEEKAVEDPTTVEEVEEDEPEEEEKKPPIDLFKAIFLDSSDEEEDEEKEDEPVKEKAEEKAEDKSYKSEKEKLFGTEMEADPNEEKKPWEEQKKPNILRNLGPAKGIFAKVDFDALNKKKTPKENKDNSAKEKDSELSAEETKKKLSVEEPKKPEFKPIFTPSTSRKKASDFFDDGEPADEAMEFGPPKPTLMQIPLKNTSKTSSSENSDSSSDEEDRKKKKKKKHKDGGKKSKKAKKSSKKKHKKDSKKKKKKSKKKDSTSSDSEDSD